MLLSHRHTSTLDRLQTAADTPDDVIPQYSGFPLPQDGAELFYCSLDQATLQIRSSVRPVKLRFKTGDVTLRLRRRRCRLTGGDDEKHFAGSILPDYE